MDKCQPRLTWIRRSQCFKSASPKASCATVIRSNGASEQSRHATRRSPIRMSWTSSSTKDIRNSTGNLESNAATGAGARRRLSAAHQSASYGSRASLKELHPAHRSRSRLSRAQERVGDAAYLSPTGAPHQGACAPGLFKPCPPPYDPLLSPLPSINTPSILAMIIPSTGLTIPSERPEGGGDGRRIRSFTSTSYLLPTNPPPRETRSRSPQSAAAVLPTRQCL